MALRGTTPGRLRAASRALDQERERLTLFAGELAAEQETPEERIGRIDRRLIDYDAGHRQLAARQWRYGRKLLQDVGERFRAVLLRQWNISRVPPEAEYFADFLRTRLREWGIIEGKFNRRGSRHPGLLDEAAYLDSDDLRRAWLAPYFDTAGTPIARSRTTPAPYPSVPLGAWKIVSFPQTCAWQKNRRGGGASDR